MSAGLQARLRGRRGDVRLDADLDAPSGLVTALTGPSGAGKSTLLRAVAGLERLEGSVFVDGEAWQEAARFEPPHRRRAGLVFQHAALLPHLSVEGNLRYGWRRAGRPDGALEHAVALTGIGPWLSRSPSRLSGGERRRVALARTLACAPRLLLLDEPLSGLDTVGRADLLADLRALLSSLPVPVLYVSHDPGEVARVADRVLELRDGRITLLPPATAASDDARLRGLSPEQVLRLATAALDAGLDARPIRPSS